MCAFSKHVFNLPPRGNLYRKVATAIIDHWKRIRIPGIPVEWPFRLLMDIVIDVTALSPLGDVLHRSVFLASLGQ